MKEAAVVDRIEVRSYYGRPVIAPPVWTWEVPVYLFAGGLAGASAGLAFASEVAGRDLLARRAWGVAGVAIGACPPLLVSDLGRPERFLNMMRVFKVTSPMSVGSWLLAAAGTTTGAAAASRLISFPSRRFAGASGAAAAALGMPLATYTGVLLANTAVPVWHEARRELPFLFAAGAAASAGAAATAITPAGHAGPARRLAIGAAVTELAIDRAMRRRLGSLAGVYSSGAAGRWHRAASALMAGGAGALAAGGRPGSGSRSRALAVTGGTLTIAGALATRIAVFRAGFASAEDPTQTIAPQRERVAAPPIGDAQRKAS